MEKKYAGVICQWEGVGGRALLSASALKGGIFAGKNLSMGGVWRAKVIRARTGEQTDEAQPTRG